MASKRNSFLLQPSGYTPEIDALSWEEKGKLLVAIYAHAGANCATMPELSPMAEMAISYIFDEMDRYSAMCKDKAEVGRSGGLASSKSKRLKRAEEEDKK